MEEAAGKYRLGERLGGGGMAEVFRAQLLGAEGFSRAVAIKRVLPGFSSDPRFGDMFVREAHIASLLAHPNIVPVFDFDRDEDDQLFIVMELVSGKDLRAVADEGVLPRSVTTYVVSELLRALSYAHRLEHDGRPMGIVHRDVTPHNVLVSWQGAVKLSDFGIAKALAESPVTSTGVVKGKAAYLSPEQARAEELDGRSDLFAVGVILHELLVGERLFGVKNGAPDMVVVRRVLKMDVPAPRSKDPSISTELEDVCLTLLARDRNARFASAQHALDALLSCPEISARGQLDLLNVMRERFAADAPSVSARALHVPSGKPVGDFTGVGEVDGAERLRATKFERPGRALIDSHPTEMAAPEDPLRASAMVAEPEDMNAQAHLDRIGRTPSPGDALRPSGPTQSEPDRLIAEQPIERELHALPQDRETVVETDPPDTTNPAEHPGPAVGGQPLDPNTVSAANPSARASKDASNDRSTMARPDRPDAKTVAVPNPQSAPQANDRASALQNRPLAKTVAVMGPPQHLAGASGRDARARPDRAEAKTVPVATSFDHLAGGHKDEDELRRAIAALGLASPLASEPVDTSPPEATSTRPSHPPVVLKRHRWPWLVAMAVLIAIGTWTVVQLAKPQAARNRVVTPGAATTGEGRDQGN